MQKDDEVQADLDAAQADLEQKLGTLKEVIVEKLEKPKHVIEEVEKPVKWAIAHPVTVGIVAAVGVAAGMFATGYVLRRIARAI